ncbi:hypothetical protein Riggi_4 [Bacillus phage Riggi]|uniref:Uncharacterized protein n=1 Tax=Bacillus phage Riggi TaxID=2884426 RepID=U5PWN4_9CAUD|nr:hypothetical protein Riggi_4 [Bacillus phage Riggi]AGY48166.1 hypothetical protein Riggi_4 [Bacillus phage Riggi]
MDNLVNNLDMIGAMFLCLLVITFCICASVAFVVSTIRWIRKGKKPPCQHNLMVCDYKKIYDDDFTVGHQYLAACKKCGKTNWVSANYLNEMSQLGLYDKEAPK